MVDISQGSVDGCRAYAPDLAQYVDRIAARRGRQELDGEILDDSAGALWRWQWIDAARVARAPDLRRVVVASPAYLHKHGTPRHPRELADANCVRFRGPSGPWWVFHEFGKAIDVPIRGNLEFNHVAPAADACVAGVGFGMFISYQVARHISEKRLAIVLEEFEPPRRPIHVVVPHARLLPRRTALLVEWIRRELGALKL